KRVVDIFRGAKVRPERDWAMRGGVILAFQEPTGDSWDMVCTPSTIRPIPVSHFAETDDRDERAHFVHLLNRCLEVKLRPDQVWFERHRELYYFAPTPTLSKRRIAFQSVAQ